MSGLFIGFKNYLLFDLRMFYREPMAVLFTFVLLAVFYSAAVLSAGGAPEAGRYSAAFVGIIILIVALFTVGPSLVLGRELGFFKRLLATPLDTIVILLSAILRAFIVVLGGLLELVLLDYLLTGSWPNWAFLQFMATLVISSVSIFAGGVLLGSIFKSTRTAFAVSVVLMQPLMFLSGATIPFDQLSEPIQKIAYMLPTTHAVTLLQLGWVGQLFSQEAIVPLIFLTVFGLLCGVLARKLFRWTLI